LFNTISREIIELTRFNTVMFVSPTPPLRMHLKTETLHICSISLEDVHEGG